MKKIDNIILIGMPGCGKSTVGVILAKRLGMDFVDSDILIANKTGRTVPQILRDEGIEGFLSIEGEIGSEMTYHHTVIATGGSMVLSEDAMKTLSKNSLVIWLDTPVDKIAARISGELKERGVASRPGMSVNDIYSERLPYYKRFAEIIISCRGNVASVLKKIISILNGEYEFSIDFSAK